MSGNFTQEELEHLTKLALASGRMLDRCLYDETTGCVEWLGSVNSSGYGLISFFGPLMLTHRLSYEAHVGPIPEGLHIDHLCRNRLCVRPEHLEPVTPAENNRRAAAAITHCINGHEYTPETTIIKKRGAGRSLTRGCRTCVNAQQRAGRERAKQRAKASDVQAWLDEQRDSA